MAEACFAEDSALQQVLVCRLHLVKYQNPVNLVCEQQTADSLLTCCCKVVVVLQLTSIWQH